MANSNYLTYEDGQALFSKVRTEIDKGGGGGDIAASAEGSSIILTDSADARVQELKIYGKTEDGSSVGSSGTLTVTLTGKNHIAIPSGYPVNITGNSEDWTIEMNDDGSFYISGVSSVATYYSLVPRASLLQGGITEGETYILTSGTDNTGWASHFIFLSSNQGEFDYRALNNDTVSFTAPDFSQYPQVYVGIYIAKNHELDRLLVKPMIRRSGTDSEYESYISSTFSLTAGLPLRGIEVESGGTYTDDHGQQWIADEIDLAAGQRAACVLNARLYA